MPKANLLPQNLYLFLILSFLSCNRGEETPILNIATAANMLLQQGWQFDSTWGRQVKATMMLDPNLLGLDRTHTFSTWQAYGIRRFNGDDLPSRSDMSVSLIAPDGEKGRFYLVYNNFRLLHQLTPSIHDTLALTYLSEKIKQ